MKTKTFTNINFNEGRQSAWRVACVLSYSLFICFFRFYSHINCNTAFHFAENIRMLLNNLPTYVIIITSGHGISAEKPAQRAKNKYK